MTFLEKLKWRYSAYNRARKMVYIADKISEQDTVIDVGVFPIQEGKTHSEANYIDEYFLSHNRKITALGLKNGGGGGQDYSYFVKRYTNCELILFDGIHFPVFQKKFNVALSNAVIEHVGNREFQLQWLIGLSKCCERLIITTPNRFFPVESHSNKLFIHWFPVPIRNRLSALCGVRKGFFDDLFLLSKREFLSLVSEAGFTVLSIKGNRILGMASDFVIILNPRRNKIKKGGIRIPGRVLHRGSLS